MRISSVSDNSWLYTLLNNSANRVQTGANQTASPAQQVNGITNIDGDSFALSGAGTNGGGQLYGASNDSDALDLKSFLDKVANGTVTQEDLDDMKEKLSRSYASGAMPPPPPPSGQNGGEDSIKAFLDKVEADTVTETDLEEMQAFLSQMSQTGYAAASSSSTDNSTAFVNHFASQLIEAYNKTGKVI